MTRKVDQNNVEEVLALSPMQEGILFHYIKKSDSSQYFEQLSITFKEELDIEIFKKAWKYVVEANEMLRVAYKWKQISQPVQIILKQYDPNICIEDISQLDENSILEELERIKQNDRKATFDLEEVPFRIILCVLNKKRYEMIISFHHILLDGWSTSIILNEFFNEYVNLSSMSPVKQSQKKTKYVEYIKWIQKQNKQEQYRYWSNYLSEYNPKSIMSMGKKIDPSIDNQYSSYSYSVEPECGHRINKFIKDNHVTLASFIYTVWGLLLQRYTNSNDIVFGTTVSGRNVKIPKIENMVGLFINTVPLRVTINEATLFADLISSINQDVHERAQFNLTSLADIQSFTSTDHGESLFDSIVVIENYPMDRLLSNENQLSVDTFSMYERTNYNLTLCVSASDHIQFTILYNENLFEEEDMIRFMDHFHSIMNHVLSDPCVKSKDALALPSIEMQIDKQQFDRELVLPTIQIHEIFEEAVNRTPFQTAAIFNGEEMSYQELNKRANQLARVLVNKGVNKNQTVALMLDRSFEMLIVILAVLKAGGAFLPIDPYYPEERIDYMIQDSQTQLLITTTLNKRILSVDIETIVVDRYDFQESEDNLNIKQLPSNLAYVIYTSGTTGTPKGVMIEHLSVVNLLYSLHTLYPLSDKDAFLFKTTFTFDVSIPELFSWFLDNGKVIITANGEEKDSKKILNLIERYKITHINFVPSMLSTMLNHMELDEIQKLNHLTYLFVAGEAISRNVVDKFYSNVSEVQLENLYGPTESTVYATRYSITAKDSARKDIPIGIPLPNTEVYILDPFQNIQPLYAPGELFISGRGLARGYLNKDNLTSERFINNPFKYGEKLYKTGDMVRWSANGNVEFLGRSDEQVKIRGFRIETEEIESALMTYGSIQESIVAIKSEDQQNSLYAYFISRESESIPDLIDYLKQKLPYYMVPSRFMQLDHFPLTSSGKIDKKNLPEPIVIEFTNDNHLDEHQTILSNIWKSLLKTEHVSSNSNFFELGGHSLKAIALVSHIQKQFDLEIAIQSIFENPTLSSLARYIQQKQLDIDEEIDIKVSPDREFYPVSSAQHRMYIVSNLDEQSINYNLAKILMISGPLDIDKVKQAFEKMIERHESLRTSFHMIGNELVQKIDKRSSLELPYIEISDHHIEQYVRDFIKPFDLSQSPLFRVEVVKIASSQKYFLFFDIHHIITDAISNNIFVKEFTTLYKGQNPLSHLPINYKDYAQWQRSYVDSDRVKLQMDYWINQLKDVPQIDIAIDQERPEYRTNQGEIVQFEIKQFDTFHSFVHQHNTTTFNVLLTIFLILLYKLSDETDLVIGTPVSGRNHSKTENLIGMFVNMLALRNHIDEEQRFIELVEEVTKVTLKGIENQEVQFDHLVDILSLPRNPSRNPICDIVFTVENTEKETLVIPGLKIKPLELEMNISKFDLFLRIDIKDGEMLGKFEYNTQLYTVNTIHRMGHYFNCIVELVFNNQDICLRDIHLNELQTS